MSDPTRDPLEPLIRDLMATFPSVSGFRQVVEDHRTEISAALSTPPPSLDVKRLAVAIATASDNAWPKRLVYSGSQTPLAEAIAHEYARSDE